MGTTPWWWLIERLGLWPRMALVLTTGLAILSAAFGFLGEGAVRESTARLMEERRILAQMAAGEIDALLRRVEQVLRQQAEGLLRGGEAGEEGLAARLAQAYANRDPQLAALLFPDPQGQVRAVAPSGFFRVGGSVRDLPDLEAAMRPEGVGLSRPFRHPVNRMPLVGVGSLCGSPPGVWGAS